MSNGAEKCGCARCARAPKQLAAVSSVAAAADRGEGGQ